MKTRALSLLLLLAPLLLSSAPAFAAKGDFQPYKPESAAEQVSAPLFVVLAYSLIWIVLLGFVVSVWHRQRRIERELAELQRQLERETR